MVSILLEPQLRVKMCIRDRLMVGFKTMTNDLSLIIAADDQLIAADVANVLHARRICLNVIGCTLSLIHISLIDSL